VFESEHRLRHLPFFDELATLDEGGAQWQTATAGLVALRMVDAWLENGPMVISDDGWGVSSARQAIDDVPDGTPIRALLHRVIDALQEPRPDIHVVVTPLMAYGRALEYDAKWLLAADVYHSVLAHLHPAEDSDASIAAHLRLGSCYRNLNLIADAATAYTGASEIATAAGDMVGILRARIGEGQIALVRGNLPRAEQIFDDAIARATKPELSDVRSRALPERSGVAQIRKQYELAIRLAYDALNHSESAPERDRILSDIAHAFSELGVYSAARDAYLVLSVTAQEQFMRWAASINLLDIAAKTGAEVPFEMYRRQLSGQRLPPYLATALELNLGVGFQRLSNFPKARHHLQRTMTMAEEHGLNQFVFEAEEALLSLETPTPSPRAPAELSLDLEEVAMAIKDLRQSAGV
jgi:tetratricopeptide (TPR) repeat protein